MSDDDTIKVTLHTSPHTTAGISGGPYPSRNVEWASTKVAFPFYAGLIEYALDDELSFLPPGPPPTRRQKAKWRLRSWWDRNRPRVHRGPCSHDDCDW